MHHLVPVVNLGQHNLKISICIFCYPFCIYFSLSYLKNFNRTGIPFVSGACPEADGNL